MVLCRKVDKSNRNLRESVPQHCEFRCPKVLELRRDPKGIQEARNKQPRCTQRLQEAPKSDPGSAHSPRGTPKASPLTLLCHPPKEYPWESATKVPPNHPESQRGPRGTCEARNKLPVHETNRPGVYTRSLTAIKDKGQKGRESGSDGQAGTQRDRQRQADRHTETGTGPQEGPNGNYPPMSYVLYLGGNKVWVKNKTSHGGGRGNKLLRTVPMLNHDCMLC